MSLPWSNMSMASHLSKSQSPYDDLLVPLWSSLHPYYWPSPVSVHPGCCDVPSTYQSCACLRTFTLAASSACNTFPPHPCLPLSALSLLKCHLPTFRQTLSVYTILNCPPHSLSLHSLIPRSCFVFSIALNTMWPAVQYAYFWPLSIRMQAP